MKAARYVLYPLIVLLFLGGCAPSTHLRTPPETTAGVSPDAPNTLERERLTQLWQRRTQERTLADHPIGPGDVLELSVPAIEELKDRTVRVSGEGTIMLPYVGVVRTAGMTDNQVSTEIRRRLEKYMYHPEVSLFVREYRSRQVAVMGAVTKPGLYTLASGTDTILDMLGAAGGMTEGAASHILFIPAEPAVSSGPSGQPAASPLRFVSTTPLPASAKDVNPIVSTTPLPAIAKDVNPITIDLQALGRGENQMHLAVPVRPGDVILVPSAGQVLVEGWVDKPGSYKITPELTVLGAVAAAGGPLFPANTSAVKVIRPERGNGKIALLADLDKIKRGEQPDIPVRAGDVIEVSSSAAKMVPYGFYRFFTTVLSVGASVPLR